MLWSIILAEKYQECHCPDSICCFCFHTDILALFEILKYPHYLAIMVNTLIITALVGYSCGIRCKMTHVSVAETVSEETLSKACRNQRKSFYPPQKMSNGIKLH